MSKALKKGWLMFTEYCRTRGIETNGNEIRKLAKVSEEYKENTTPTSTRPLKSLRAGVAKPGSH